MEIDKIVDISKPFKCSKCGSVLDIKYESIRGDNRIAYCLKCNLDHYLSPSNYFTLTNIIEYKPNK